MKSITKGYRLVNNKVGRLKSMYRRGSVDSMNPDFREEDFNAIETS
jgi:hypothetical protein